MLEIRAWTTTSTCSKNKVVYIRFVWCASFDFFLKPWTKHQFYICTFVVQIDKMPWRTLEAVRTGTLFDGKAKKSPKDNRSWIGFKHLFWTRLRHIHAIACVRKASKLNQHNTLDTFFSNSFNIVLSDESYIPFLHIQHTNTTHRAIKNESKSRLFLILIHATRIQLNG